MRVGQANAFRTNRCTQSGVALVIVLLILAMATTLATFTFNQQGFWLRSVRNSLDRAQARYIAEGGIDWARAVLADDAAHNSIDHAGEMWAIQLPAIPIENGEVQGLITDQQGLFNLNNLVQNGVASIEDVLRFQRLLEVLGLPSELSATLLDWLDKDSQVSESGAEDEYYESLPQPYRCANRPLTGLGELTLVKGFDQNVIRRLKPFVSALPESKTALNLNFAPPEVLVALFPGLTLQDARKIARETRTTPFKTVGDFLLQLPAGIRQENLPPVSVNSQYFLVTARARLGQGRATITTLLKRDALWAQQQTKEFR